MARPRYTNLSVERRYDLLLSLSSRIRSTLDLDEILAHVLDAVHAALPYDAGGIFVLNRSAPGGYIGDPRQVIAGIVARGYDERPTENDMVLMCGHGLVGHAIRTGEFVVVSDVRADPRYFEGRRATRSEVVVPIVSGGESIGALNLESDRMHAFDDEDLEILHVFADAASAAIGRALLHHELMERRRVDHQMQLAQAVQTRLLPRSAPVVPGYEFAGVCLPTFEIGGDYYDYLELPDDRIGLAVADVSGKGIAAALSMTAFRTILRTQAPRRLEPSHLANRLNELTPDSTAESAYVTCVYALLEPREHCLRYTNCGHNPPLLLRSDDRIERLDRGGFPLGIFRDSRYETAACELGAGELVLFYTDGVVECPDPNGEEFGIERLEQVLVRSRHLPAEGIIDAILRATRAHGRTVSFDDDFTVMIVRRTE